MTSHKKYLGLALLLAFSAFAQVDTSSIQMFETLDEVEIDRDPGVRLSKKSVLSKELISEVELRKAACCDLSESFETNASISASFTDAVTGTRQIRLLGLEGPYALYTRGNLQTMGGLSSVLGLALIPGAWIQSIQLTKGPGSVVNGAGAMSGQINYELRPSFTEQKAHFNLFAGPGRFEQNAIYTWKQSKRWSSNVMVHGRQQLFRWDGNNDGYLDSPLSQHIFVQNAWKHNGKFSEAQFGLKASAIKNIGGSTLYGYPTLVPIWSHELQTNRYELWAKRGYFLDGGINRSMGTQLSAVYQDLDSYFGNRTFNAIEQRLYGNLIFQDNIFDTRHTLKGGLDFNNFFIHQDMWGYNGDNDGFITGIYGEYSYVNSPDGEGLSMILGQRYDRVMVGPRVGSNFYYVPRLHLKYNHNAWSFRSQASYSYRVATLGAEYMGYMANNRHVLLEGNVVPIESGTTYGVGVAWNKDVLYKELQWYADIYYTQFDSKVVVDLDGSTDTMRIETPGDPYSRQYDNIGQMLMYSPYSLSAQLGGQYELFHRTLVKVAYRYQDVKQRDLNTYRENPLALEEVILNVPHLVYVGYENRSPAFTMLNGQISKDSPAFGQIYVGIQNALNVRQLNPVVGGDLPFDGRFDASVVWGPIMGRQIYAGWRYDLKFQE